MLFRSAHEIALVLRHKNAVFEIDLSGKSELVLVKSAQKDPVTQIIEHIDLVEVKKGEKVHVEVPVHIVGESLSGTTVDLEHKTVKLEVEATSIPEFVEVVVSSLMKLPQRNCRHLEHLYISEGKKEVRLSGSTHKHARCIHFDY